jgi:hypothetical protein
VLTITDNVLEDDCIKTDGKEVTTKNCFEKIYTELGAKVNIISNRN